MTIPEMAEKHGVSKQLVYRKLKTVGLDVSTLMSGKKGVLSVSGERVLEELLTSTGESPSVSVRPSPSRDDVDQLTEKVDQLQSALDEANAALKASNERVRELELSAEVLSVKLVAAESERDFLRASLAREQSEVQHVALLLSAAPARKLTLRERLTGRIRQDQHGQQEPPVE